MGKKRSKDPNAPKRNMSAYLLYQNAMREPFKAQNPGMSFGQLSKFTSAMYAELEPEEKEAWQARADVDKARYLQELAIYIPPPGYDAKGDAIMQFHQSTGRRKRERDPNAPKRAKSAYLLYQNAMREQFRRENPGMTFGQLSKYTSAMYKCLTLEERATWDARAAQDKIRYQNEMAAYVPPPGCDAQGNVLEEYRNPTKKPRKVKDPNAPKRARGSFVYFTFDERPKLMQEMPGIKFTEIGAIMGERWRNLAADQKKKYEDQAAQDKVRFNREMQEYNATKVVVPSLIDPTAPQAAPQDMMSYMSAVEYDPTAAYQQPAYDPSATYQYH